MCQPFTTKRILRLRSGQAPAHEANPGSGETHPQLAEHRPRHCRPGHPRPETLQPWNFETWNSWNIRNFETSEPGTFFDAAKSGWRCAEELLLSNGSASLVWLACIRSPVGCATSARDGCREDCGWAV